MPIKKSAFKAQAQSLKRQKINKKVKSDLTALIRKVRKSVVAKDSAKATDWLKQTVKKIDRAAQKGILKKNTAARKKSRLAKAVKSLSKK